MSPYGAFLDVLAVPGVSFLPQTTPMKDRNRHPASGLRSVHDQERQTRTSSYELDLNPNYAAQAIPGIPAGHVDVHVKIESNTTTEASDVLNNKADVFDWGDTIPPALVAQIESQASDRYRKLATRKTFYFFLNTTQKPFTSALARQAVIEAARSQRRSQGSAAASLIPGLLPAPAGDGRAPDRARARTATPRRLPTSPPAKQLVQQSGCAGYAVTVWAQNREPRLEWAENVGHHAERDRVQGDAQDDRRPDYFSTIETLKNHPQIGFADWQQDFPNPTDFYQNLVDANAIVPWGNSNYEEVNDPHIQSELKQLYPIPASQITGAVASKWQALDTYVTKQGVPAVVRLPRPRRSSCPTRSTSARSCSARSTGNDFSSLQMK